MRLLLIVLGLGLGLGLGRAEAGPRTTVALLPLDADRRLELYGQPVASEIARALVAGEIDVVVVGPKMAVPERAGLIVDGTITAKGDDVTLSVRVRRRIDGTVLDTLTAGSPLAELDKAATDLSSRLLPSVRRQLAILDAPPAREPIVPSRPIVAAKPRVLLVGAIASTGATRVEPLRAALAAATDTWVIAHGRTPKDLEGKQLARATAIETVAASDAELAIAFEVARYDVAHVDGVPIARARVRVRVASASQVLFDRVVQTDSIVGAKAATTDLLAAAVAREVLSILRPHLTKIGWP